MFYKKYIKYKNKYLKLKMLVGGDNDTLLYLIRTKLNEVVNNYKLKDSIKIDSNDNEIIKTIKEKMLNYIDTIEKEFKEDFINKFIKYISSIKVNKIKISDIKIKDLKNDGQLVVDIKNSLNTELRNTVQKIMKKFIPYPILLIAESKIDSILKESIDFLTSSFTSKINLLFDTLV